MRTRVLVALAVALYACDSDKGKDASEARKAPPVTKADEPPIEVDGDKEAELIANAPPEGEIIEDETKDETKDAAAADWRASVLDHEVKLLDGTPTSLDKYRGKALLVVNTASECGYTPQYEDLQTVYAEYKDRGFEVLAFPSNDYGSQEPGGPDEIRKFVDDQYHVEFPMFEKAVVKGPEKIPLFKALTENVAEPYRGEVRWNFTKFLVDPEGKVVARFEPKIKPTDPEVRDAIERVLPQG